MGRLPGVAHHQFFQIEEVLRGEFAARPFAIGHKLHPDKISDVAVDTVSYRALHTDFSVLRIKSTCRGSAVSNCKQAPCGAMSSSRAVAWH